MALVVVTHDGEFHADDVVGVSLLRWTLGNFTLERTRDMELIQRADIVLDVGGIYNPEKKRFDHHQKEYEGRLASAGMVLKWLVREEKLDIKFAEYLEELFINGVDRQDNGLYSPQSGICTFSDFIWSFNPFLPSVSEKDYLVKFEEAVILTCQFLERLKNRYIQKQKYRKIFREILKKQKSMPPHLLVLDDQIPWKEYVWEEPECEDIWLAIFPVTKKKWILHTIPETRENPYSSRIKLPESWAGLLEGDLEKKCGLKEAIFCHKQRFMAAFKTKEAALHAANLALKGAKK
ncbi:MAG: MYG1 family protein [Candidatus Aureabacteria bacterium]|nr:MYG1 family protein [Candidatus Auribacterota bacterium]